MFPQQQGGQYGQPQMVMQQQPQMQVQQSQQQPILAPCKFDRYNNPIMWADQYGGYYIKGDNGQLAACDQYGRIIQNPQQQYVSPQNTANQQQPLSMRANMQQQQYMMQQQHQAQYQPQQQYQQQQQVGIGGIQPQFQQPEQPVVNKPVRYTGTGQKPQYRKTTPQKQQVQQQVVENVRVDISGLYKPEPGSEVIPLYNEDTEYIDVAINEQAKTYKILVIEKG